MLPLSHKLVGPTSCERRETYTHNKVYFLPLNNTFFSWLNHFWWCTSWFQGKILYALGAYVVCLTDRAGPTPMGPTCQWDKSLICPTNEIPFVLVVVWTCTYYSCLTKFIWTKSNKKQLEWMKLQLHTC